MIIAIYVFNNSFFVFRPAFSVTDSMFLTLYIVIAYIKRNILYNESVKSKEVTKMNMKKENLANCMEIEIGGGKV